MEPKKPDKTQGTARVKSTPSLFSSRQGLMLCTALAAVLNSGQDCTRQV